jgi:hypothetical protein
MKTQQGGYMIVRTLLIAAAVCGLIFAGCGKKPKQAQVQNIPQIPTTAAPTPAPAPAPAKVDTGDVFKEFYKGPKETKAKTGAPESYTPEFSENGRYVVQIAAGPSSAGAEELANAFKGKGYPAYVAEVQNPTPEISGTYYRVRIGGFAALADAKAFGENILRPANYDYWVDLKSNDAVGTGTPAAQAPFSSGTSTYTPYTPSTSEPSTPVYMPTTPSAAPAPESNYGAASTPSTIPSTSEGSSWSTGSSTVPSAEPQATPPATPPATSTESTLPSTTTPPTDTSKGGWGGGWNP